jgi:signal transduction histidine kinase
MSRTDPAPIDPVPAAAAAAAASDAAASIGGRADPTRLNRADAPQVEPVPVDSGSVAPVDTEQMLARLAAGLAHEIKNPLSTMAINLALLEEEWSRSRESGEPSAREKRAVKRISTLQREIKRLETIVDDFLRYARGGEVNRAPRDPRSWCARRSTSSRPRTRSRGSATTSSCRWACRW